MTEMTLTDIRTGVTTTVEIGPEPSRPLDAEELGAAIRALRTKLLSDCDYTQLPDAPLPHALWATYRQALRDIPEQAGFPADIIWPTPPT